MKPPPPAQSATSLPRAPRDDAGRRIAKYMITMGIRVGCFVAMVLITPYGWYTWVFALGAVFLPYVAVVIANVGQGDKPVAAVSPERTLPSTPAPGEAPQPAPQVIRIDEAPPSAPRVIRIDEAPPTGGREPER